MRLSLFPILAIVAILGWLGSAGPVHGQITESDVNRAIDKGRSYLIRRQNSRGDWDGLAGQHQVGMTALCTLALISAGQPPDSEPIQKALEYLRKVEAGQQTYTESLLVMALCAAGFEVDRTRIREHVTELERLQLKEGDSNGGWDYGFGQGATGSADNSNAQFALLALHEAERRGIEVKDSTWRRALMYWQKQQLASGAWRYKEGYDETGSMTSAGLASLIIASGEVAEADARVVDGQVVCCGNQEAISPVEKGLDWLAKHFSVRTNPHAGRGGQVGGGLQWHYYYLYGLERVGRMSGRRFIGKHDWYREGAEFLIAEQDKIGGAWPSGIGGLTSEAQSAFALLFLSKGRRPVVASKLRHGDSVDWNRHRLDLAQLTGHVETRWDQLLTWQTIDARQASITDLLDTPVIYISGRDGLTLSNQEKQLLKQYVAQGGFIFADAACSGEGFDRQFRQLMEELFPDSPLRLLPPDHPVWYAEQQVSADHLRPLWGIEACCRTSIVYCPENLSCYWELAGSRQMAEYPAEIRADVEACLAIGANVLTYATNRQLRGKLDTPELIPVASDTGPPNRGTLTVVKLQHSGGSDDAPSALANLLRSVQQETRLPVDLTKRVVAPDSITLTDHPVAFVHGRRTFRMNDAQRQGLRKFLTQGGFLFGDAICANTQFADSFRQEMQSLIPGAVWQTVPADHPMFTAKWNGFDVRQLKLREPQSRQNNGEGITAQTRSVAPRLEGLLVDDRYVVLFSPWDLSCALENLATLECLGYTKEDAARLGTNMLLYGMQN